MQSLTIQRPVNAWYNWTQLNQPLRGLMFLIETKHIKWIKEYSIYTTLNNIEFTHQLTAIKSCYRIQMMNCNV